MRRTLRALPLLLALAALAAAALPAAAQATRVVREGDALILRADPGEVNHLAVSDDPFSSDRLHFGDRGRYGITWDPSLDCTGFDTGMGSFADCTYPGITEVRLEGADGDDELDVSWDELPRSLVYVLDGGPGNDHLEGPTTDFPITLLGGEGDDHVYGGQGADVLDGGPGNDDVDGNDGDDVVQGGPGDDVVSGGRRMSTDVIDGGPGNDASVADWNDNTAEPQPIAVSLDGVANDGRAGEQDNVVGIERIRTAQVATLIAGADPVEFEVEKSRVGPSRLVGGPGADRLATYVGDDTIDGGAGPDVIFAHLGSDTVEARDGERDVIDCGDGVDTAFVDPIDAVSNCETVIGGKKEQEKPPKDEPKPPAAKTCKVPKVKRGATLTAVRRALTKAHCKRTKVRKARSRVRKGRVVKLSAKAGAKPKGTVTIYVSRG